MAQKGSQKGDQKGAPKGDQKGAPKGDQKGAPKGDQKGAQKADSKAKADPKAAQKGAAKGREEARPSKPPKPRRREQYETEVVPALMKRFGFTNKLRVPRLEKIVINMGVGDALQNIKLLDAAMADLALISGQRPALRRAKKSISNFKLREGAPIGCKVTLRSARMWEFYDRLVSLAVPRIRDFRGFPVKSFDGRGSYTFGVREQIVFPEIDYDKVEKVRGMNVTFVTTARTDEEGFELLRLMKWPFREK
jgi:large subunit ribosomal protein L5